MERCLVETINELAGQYFETPDGLIKPVDAGFELIVNPIVDQNFGTIKCITVIDDETHRWVQNNATIRGIAHEIDLIDIVGFVGPTCIERATLDGDHVLFEVLGSCKKNDD